MQRFLVQGNEKIREQEFEQAERFFQSALKLDSCFADALNNLGTVEQRRQNPERAVEYYSKAIRCNDQFQLAYFNRANMYLETGQFNKALKDVAVLENASPDSISILELKGLVLWKMHDIPQAISSFRRVLQKNGKEKNALINLGTLYTSLRRFDSARFFLEKALNTGEADPQIFNALAMLESENGNPSEAAKWIDKALKISESDPYFLNNKGYVLLLLNQDEKAISFIDQAIVADPYNGWAYRNKGIYLYRQKKFDEAIKLFQRAEKLDPYVDNLFYWLGMTKLSLGLNEEACAYFKKAAERNQLISENPGTDCK
jgi:tetratricopeptide (TPR) repeat protein